MPKSLPKKTLYTALFTSTMLALPSIAQAQQISSDWTPSDSSSQSYGSPYSAPAAPQEEGSSRHSGGGGGGHPRTTVTPYIEVQQVATADFYNHDVLTYSTIAVGVDTSIHTRRAEAQINARYERTIPYGNNMQGQNVISGLARGSVKLAPGLSFEAGGIATRSKVDGRGASPTNLVGNPDNITQVYSIYAGPSFSTQIQDLSVNAAYRAGYTKVEAKTTGTLPTGQLPVASFDSSVSQTASASIGMQPGVLPFGWAVGVGYNREDAGQLDRRLDDKSARLDITMPVGNGLAIVGGVGYEKVSVSERDAMRDGLGNAIVGTDGRYITNTASPRLNAYASDGLTWDAGFLWKPSSRTSVTASYGRRYGSESYSGSLSYQPGRNWAVNVNAYDTITGFGNMLNSGLANMPTTFRSSRNPLSGDVGGCAFAQSGGFCLNDALSTASSTIFRARGINAALSSTVGGWDTGVAVGYSRRKFITALTGAQANLNGLVDENYSANLSLGKDIDRASRFETNIYANYFDPGMANANDVISMGANAAYHRQIMRWLSASLAVGVDSFDQKTYAKSLTGSALAGLRFSF